MTRKSNRPEDLWINATPQQVADLRKWIQSRMEQRHAHSMSAWLLSLGTDEPAEPHRRQLAFFRRILDQYGPPRTSIDGDDSPEDSADSTDTDTATPEPPSDVTDGPEAPESAPKSASAAQPAGRFRRA